MWNSCVEKFYSLIIIHVWTGIMWLPFWGYIGEIVPSTGPVIIAPHAGTWKCQHWRVRHRITNSYKLIITCWYRLPLGPCNDVKTLREFERYVIFMYAFSLCQINSTFDYYNVGVVWSKRSKKQSVPRWYCSPSYPI